MAIFNSYVKLPEGIWDSMDFYGFVKGFYGEWDWPGLTTTKNYELFEAH